LNEQTVGLSKEKTASGENHEFHAIENTHDHSNAFVSTPNAILLFDDK